MSRVEPPRLCGAVVMCVLSFVLCRYLSMIFEGFETDAEKKLIEECLDAAS